MPLFVELSIILLLAAIVSFVMRLLRQPLVVGYILTGVLVGPYGLHLLELSGYIELFSKIGIATLLFIVGLNLKPTVIRELGIVSFVAGVGQILFTSVVGYFIVRALGFGVVASLYAAIALTLSSTIIILKLLSDKGDLQKLYGKISIGILLVQDLVATILLVVISTTNLPAATGGIGETLLFLFLRGALLTAALFIISRYLLPKISALFASSQELLFVFSLAWGFGMATLFHLLGFSIEIGALIAGVSLSLSPFSYEIGSRVKPLRDFFIMLFFVLLGSELFVAKFPALIAPALLLSLFVLIGNPLIVAVLMNLLGFKRKTGFMTGLTVAQISEFSLILVALGLTVGHISEEVVSLITLVGIITISVSTYLILYAEKIYTRMEWFLKSIEIRKPRRKNANGSASAVDVLIFGYDKVGADYVHAAQKLGGSYLVIDFNPATIRSLEQQGIPHRYGDAEDVEFLEELPLADAKLVVSTIPEFRPNMTLVKTFRKANLWGIIMAMSHDVAHARELYLAGASYVVMPYYLGAHHASLMIARHGFDVHEFERERNIHLLKLAKRTTH